MSEQLKDHQDKSIKYKLSMENEKNSYEWLDCASLC